MHRRIMIRNLLLAGGGYIVLGSCNNDKQLDLLTELAESIIPATDTSGAKALQLSAFVLTIVNDCLSPENRQKFMQGLEAFDSYAKARTGKSFVDCNQEERIRIFLAISEEKQDPIHYFLIETRRLTINGYLNSEYVMTKLLPYVLVPGKYQGCTTLSSNQII